MAKKEGGFFSWLFGKSKEEPKKPMFEKKETRSEAGHKGGVAPHVCRGRECTHHEHKGGHGHKPEHGHKPSHAHKAESLSEKRAEAGHLGGVATHECRGRECTIAHEHTKKS